MNNLLGNCFGIIMQNKASELGSKVYGRENYIIELFDGAVRFYGTKGQYLIKGLTRVPLSLAPHITVLRFTYKKDWIANLKLLGKEVD